MTHEEYQEALDEIEEFIIEELNNNIYGTLSINHFNPQIDLLQTLIDRATPIKPIEEVEYHYSYDNGDNIDGQPSYSITNYRCPSCSNFVSEPQCCQNNDCRQAIDWEKESE